MTAAGPGFLSRRDGMTIIETVVAIVVFALCVGGICALVLQTKQTSDRARAHYTAINIAKNRLERATELGFDHVDFFGENQVVIDKNGSPDADGNYRRTTVVNDVKSNLKQMVVTVDIKDRITLSFSGENETIRSYFADIQGPPE